MDHWDPALTDGFAQDREVILFNNAGISSSSGEVPTSIEETAQHAAAFIDALGIKKLDALGFSVPPKPKPDFRSPPTSTAVSILAVSSPHQIKLLPFDCSTTKLSPSGTTPSSHNCRVVIARSLSPKRADELWSPVTSVSMCKEFAGATLDVCGKVWLDTLRSSAVKRTGNSAFRLPFGSFRRPTLLA
jgi:hypothetical protein